MSPWLVWHFLDWLDGFSMFHWLDGLIGLIDWLLCCLVVSCSALYILAELRSVSPWMPVTCSEITRCLYVSSSWRENESSPQGHYGITLNTRKDYCVPFPFSCGRALAESIWKIVLQCSVQGIGSLAQVMVGGMALSIRSFHGSKLESLNLTHSSMVKLDGCYFEFMSFKVGQKAKL